MKEYVIAIILIVSIGGGIFSFTFFVIQPETIKLQKMYAAKHNLIGNMTCKELGSYLLINSDNHTDVYYSQPLYDYAKTSYTIGHC